MVSQPNRKNKQSSQQQRHPTPPTSHAASATAAGQGAGPTGASTKNQRLKSTSEVQQPEPASLRDQWRAQLRSPLSAKQLDIRRIIPLTHLDRIVDTITSTLPALEPRLHQLLSLSLNEITTLACKPKNHIQSSPPVPDVIDIMLASVHTPPQAVQSSIDFLSKSIKNAPANALPLYAQRLASLLADDKVSIQALVPKFKLSVLVDALAQVSARSADRYDARLIEILDAPTPISAVCASGTIACESVIAVLGRLKDPESRSQEMFEYVQSRVNELEPEVQSGVESMVGVDAMDTDRIPTSSAPATTCGHEVELEDGEVVDNEDDDVNMDNDLGNLTVDQRSSRPAVGHPTNSDDADSCSSDMSLSSTGDGGTKIIEDFTSSRSASPYVRAPVSNGMPHSTSPIVPGHATGAARSAPWRTHSGSGSTPAPQTAHSVGGPTKSDTPAKSRKRRKRKRHGASTPESSTSSPAASSARSPHGSPPPSTQSSSTAPAIDSTNPSKERVPSPETLPAPDRVPEVVDLLSDSDQEAEDDKSEDMDLFIDESRAFGLRSPRLPSLHTPTSSSQTTAPTSRKQLAPWEPQQGRDPQNKPSLSASGSLNQQQCQQRPTTERHHSMSPHPSHLTPSQSRPTRRPAHVPADDVDTVKNNNSEHFGNHPAADPSHLASGTPAGPSASKRPRLHHDLVTSPWNKAPHSLSSSKRSLTGTGNAGASPASGAPFTPKPSTLDPVLAAAESAVTEASSRLAQARALESQSRAALDMARSEYDTAQAALAAAQARVSRAQGAIDLAQKALTDAQGVCTRLAADDKAARDKLAHVRTTALEREKKLQIERLKERQAQLERSKRAKAEAKAKAQVAQLLEAVRAAVDKVAPPAVAMAVEGVDALAQVGEPGPVGGVVDMGQPKTIIECVKVDEDWVRMDRLASVTSVARERPEWFIKGASLVDELNDELGDAGLDARRWEAEVIEDMERKGRALVDAVGVEDIGAEGRVPLGVASVGATITSDVAAPASSEKRRSSISSAMTNPMVAKVLGAFAARSSKDANAVAVADDWKLDSSPTTPTSVLPSEIIPCAAELVPGATCNDPLCMFTHLDDLDQPSKWLPKQVVTRIKHSSNPMALSLMLRRKLASPSVFPTERDVVICVLETLHSVLPVISLPDSLPNGGAVTLPSSRASLPIRTMGVLHKVTNGPLAKQGPRRFWQTCRTVEDWAEWVEEDPKELSDEDWLEYAVALLPTWSNMATLNDNNDQSYHAALQILVLGLKHCPTSPNLWELFMELLMRKANSRDHIQRHITKAKERVPDQWTHYWRVLDTLRDDSQLYAKTLIQFFMYTMARKADQQLVLDTLVAAVVALDEDTAAVKRALVLRENMDVAMAVDGASDDGDLEPVMPVPQFLVTALCATDMDSLKEQLDAQVDLESYPACVPEDEQGFQATLLFQLLAPTDLALAWLIFVHAIVHDSIPVPPSPASTSPLLVPGSEHVVAQRNLFVLCIDNKAVSQSVDGNRALVAKKVLEKLCLLWPTVLWADGRRDVQQEARSAFAILIQNLDVLSRATSGSESIALLPGLLADSWPAPADCWDLSIELPDPLVTSPAAWNAVAAHAAKVGDRDRVLNALVNAAHCVMVDFKVHPETPPSQHTIDNAINVYSFLLGLTYSFSPSASPPSISPQAKSMYKWHWINFLLFQALGKPSAATRVPSTTRLLHQAVAATIDMPLMWRELLTWATSDLSSPSKDMNQRQQLDPMVLSQLITSSLEPHKHSNVLRYTEHGLTHPFVMPTPVHDASHLRFVFGTILPRAPAPAKQELVQWLIEHAPALRPPADVFLVAAQLLHGTQSAGNKNGERVVKLLVYAIERGASLDGVWDLVLSFPWDKNSKERLEQFRDTSKLSILPDQSATV